MHTKKCQTCSYRIVTQDENCNCCGGKMIGMKKKKVKKK